VTTMHDREAAAAAVRAELDALYGDEIRATVEQWPPLTPEQLAGLARILGGGDHEAT